MNNQVKLTSKGFGVFGKNYVLSWFVKTEQIIQKEN